MQGSAAGLALHSSLLIKPATGSTFKGRDSALELELVGSLNLAGRIGVLEIITGKRPLRRVRRWQHLGSWTLTAQLRSWRVLHRSWRFN